MLASLYLNELKVPLIVTNNDSTALIRGRYFPGAGAILQSITTACNLKTGSHVRSTSKEEPGTYDIIGKPNPFTIDLIKEEHGLADDTRAIMIGDRPNTDVLFGKAGNLDQCLVMSGVVRGLDDFRNNWLADHPEYAPTYVMQMVGDLNATVE